MNSQPQFLPSQWKKTWRNNRGENGERSFLLDEQKSRHTCDESHRLKRAAVYLCACICVCRGVFLCACLCVFQVDAKTCTGAFFADKSCPEKQRRYSSTFRSQEAQIECVTFSREGDGRRRGGARNHCKAKKLGPEMVMVETSIHSEFPAAVPCLSRLDYFLVQGLPHFKASCLPTSVIRSF